MNEELRILAKLDADDRQIRSIEQAVVKINADIDHAATKLRKANAHRASIAESIAANKKEQHAHNHKIRLYQDRRASAVRILEQGSADPTTAERQITQCEAILDDTETLLLEALEARDTLDTDEAQAQASVTACEESLAGLRAAAPNALADNKVVLVQLRKSRNAEFAKLDTQVGKRYEAMVQRKGTAVSVVLNGACKTCQRVATQQIVSDIRRGLVVQCRGCHRWLVLPETTSA
jgi:predicted  nucleic acid-binding Zn-ribbon protein